MNNDFAKSIRDGYFAQVWPPSRFLCHRGFQRFTILMRSDAALLKFQTTWRVIKTDSFDYQRIAKIKRGGYE